MFSFELNCDPDTCMTGKCLRLFMPKQGSWSLSPEMRTCSSVVRGSCERGRVSARSLAEKTPGADATRLAENHLIEVDHLVRRLASILG